MKTHLAKHQHGFTIVELMIASGVFAAVLMVCTLGMLQIGRSYYKGITSTRTQETARSITDEVSKGIQFGISNPETLTANGINRGYCIGNKRYSYVLDRQVADSPNTAINQSRHALVADEVACAGAPVQVVAPSPPASPAGRELINSRMRLMQFDVQRIGVTDLYRVTVRVVSGDNDLLTANHMNCSAQRAGGQFCAVSELSTVVHRRVR